MIGARPLSIEEYEKLKLSLIIRDMALLVLGVRTGFRISELLSINIDKIYNKATNELRSEIRIDKSKMKGHLQARTIPLHPEATECLLGLISSIPLNSNRLRLMHPNGIPLFMSKTGHRLHRNDFHRSLKKACNQLGISTIRISSHSLRKTFAKDINEKLGNDIYALKEAMGHKSIESTSRYVQVDSEKIWNAIKGIK